jgi:Zn-dependent peptidase ImmA (M78 family)
MRNTDERIASNLLEEYASAKYSGRQVSLVSLLEKCPESEIEELRLAAEGIELVANIGSEEFVSPSLLKMTQKKINALATQRKAALQGYEKYTRQPHPKILSGANAINLLADLLGIGAPALPSMIPKAIPTTLFRGAAGQRLQNSAIAKLQKRTIEENAAQAAANLLRRTGIMDVPIDLITLSEGLGILILEENLEDCDGCIIMHGGAAGIIVNKLIQNAGRKRFTLAHELGHFELHRHLSAWCDSTENIESGWVEGLDFEANFFAAELLMPNRYMRQLFSPAPPNFAGVDKIVEQCKVSITAAAARLVRTSDYACAVVYITDDQIKWFVASDDFPYWIPVGSAPHAASGPKALALKKPITDRFVRLPVEVWVPDAKHAAEYDILEHSRQITENSSLTLLYAENIPDSEQDNE